MTQPIRKTDANHTLDLAAEISQSTFLAALLQPDLAPPEGLIDGQNRPAGRRFSVYRNNVIASLIDAMEVGFPSVFKLLGAENFRPLARLFVAEHPPHSPLLMHYGTAFPSFLAKIDALSRFPYLPDMAHLDLAIRQSYHSPDAPPFDPQDLEGNPLESLRFSFAPATKILASPQPIFSIFQHLFNAAPRPNPGPEALLITRAEFDPIPHSLPPGGHSFISGIMQGHTLGIAYENTLTTTPDFDPTPLLSLLMTSGALCAEEGLP